MHVQGKIHMLVRRGRQRPRQRRRRRRAGGGQRRRRHVGEAAGEDQRGVGGQADPARSSTPTFTRITPAATRRSPKSGGAIVAGNFAQQINSRTGGGGTAFIFAHENTLRHFELAPAGQSAPPVGAWPTDVFFGKRKDFSFNGEAVVLMFEPNAHTDGDILVHFRGSDVVAAGDVYVNTSYPILDRASGGSINSYLAALNDLLEVTVPLDKQEAGTFVVPGHGRLADEADVVEYRDMLTIIRDRVEALKKGGMTLAAGDRREADARLRRTLRRREGPGLGGVVHRKRLRRRGEQVACARRQSSCLLAAAIGTRHPGRKAPRAGQARGAAAHRAAAAAPAAPLTPQQLAPQNLSLTGYWVSVVNEDWRWRMVTPPKGDFVSLPLNPEGIKVGNSWTPAQDGSCLAYGMAGLMRMPLRIHVTWQDAQTLKIETDAGQQTRLLYFDASKAPTAASPAGPLGGAVGKPGSRPGRARGVEAAAAAALPRPRARRRSAR